MVCRLLCMVIQELLKGIFVPFRLRERVQTGPQSEPYGVPMQFEDMRHLLGERYGEISVYKTNTLLEISVYKTNTLLQQALHV